MPGSSLEIENGVRNNSAEAGKFEELYLQLRSREQRIYSDNEVRDLPEIVAGHPHFTEWVLRKRSCDRLIKHLGQKNKPLHILEVGCGNGWLSAQLAKNLSGQVVGMDINNGELMQAKRVFSEISNLKFISGDIRAGVLTQDSFDAIIFAASLQYFSSLREVLQSAFQYLRAGGEVHILDTIFYKKKNVHLAKQRTKDYYNRLGFPEATDYYYHHCIDDLKEFSPAMLYDPGSWKNKFNRNKHPFYWVCIKKP